MTNDDWRLLDARARAVLTSHDGVAKLSSFLAVDISGKQAGALVGRGVLERPRSGWYCDPSLPWQAKCAIRVGGVLACVSAVDSFGLPVPHLGMRAVHVLVASNSARRRHHRDRRHSVVPGEDREVVLHWAGMPGPLPGWRVGLVEALLQLADCVPTDWWIAALDAARHVPRDGDALIGDAEWERFIEQVPRRLRAALDLVDRRSESVLESLLRLALLRRGIVIVDLQFWPDPGHRVDFLLPGKLIIEADGAAFHDPELDGVRDAFLRGLGYRVLHFSSVRIMTDMNGVLDEIEAALLPL